jgi:HEPN domain-containing protein
MENSVTSHDAWVFFANNNIKAAENLTDDAEITGELAFLCQQAVEKYLKAFLTKHKISFQKTHDLLKLYLQVKEVKNLGINEELLQDLKSLYIEVRYPTDVALLDSGLLPSVEKAKTYLDFAKNVANIVKTELKITTPPMPSAPLQSSVQTQGTTA